MLSKITHEMIIKMLRLKAVYNPSQYMELISEVYITLHSYPVNVFHIVSRSASCEVVSIHVGKKMSF
jgi:hypothetical protein